MKRSIISLSLLLSTMLFSQPGISQQKEAEVIPISHEMKNAVIDSLIQNLKDIYIFPDMANQVAFSLEAYKQNTGYDGVADCASFAKLLTKQVQDITHDKHFHVVYNANYEANVKQDRNQEKKDEAAFERFLMKKNFGFSRLSILEGNIGYLKLDAFAPLESGRKTAGAAMDFIANTDALIIDLRENHGGAPEMVQFLASYFFDKKPLVHLNDIYYRQDNKTQQYWTVSKLPGKRYTKQVFLLTSSHTFSAGEEFANDLKTLRRATIVGEATGGGANPGGDVRIKDGFVAFIPNGRAINPNTKTNWEGVGVQPDLKTTAENALAQAQKMALEKLIETSEEKDFYQKSLDVLQKEKN